MSADARAFLILRNWLEGLDGGEFRSLTDYERRMAERCRIEAGILIERGMS